MCGRLELNRQTQVTQSNKPIYAVTSYLDLVESRAISQEVLHELQDTILSDKESLPPLVSIFAYIRLKKCEATGL